MRKVVVGTFLSLDGVMQAPGSPEEDTEGGFDQGGWQMPYFDEDAGRIMSEIIAAQNALLLGRPREEAREEARQGAHRRKRAATQEVLITSFK